MTQEHTLKVKSRTQTKSKNLRESGQVPAVIYGHGFKNLNISVDATQIEKTYQQVGESNLFDLTIDDQQPLKVVIKDIVRHPVSGRIEHVDFYKIKMDEKITVEVPFNFVGESRAIKDLGGILVKNLDNLEIECLPGNLIPEVEIDLSKLNELGDLIRVGDLQLSGNISILNDPEDAIVLAVESKKAEEEPQATEQKDEGTAKDASADKDETDDSQPKDSDGGKQNKN